jgi:hypothetical protein
VSVSRADYEALVARKARKTAQKALQATIPVTEGWQGGALVVFVPGRPRNPLNGSHEHWSKRAKWAKGWRENTNTRLYLASVGGRRSLTDWLDTTPRWPWGEASAPKRITFTIHGPSRFDDDNLRAVCKPVRDSLKDMGVIDDDRPSAGHTFHYEQAPPKRAAGAPHGIAIRIEVQG